MAPTRAGKVPPCLLLLVVSFALLGLVAYQTLKDRSISADLLKKKDSTIYRLEERLQKEEKRTSDLQKRLAKLSSQKEELNGVREGLNGKLIELSRVKSLTEDDKRKLEATLKAKENEIKDLKDRLALFDEKVEELKLMKMEMAQKDAELLKLQTQLKIGAGKAQGGWNQSPSLENSEQSGENHQESKLAKEGFDSQEAVSEMGHVATEVKAKEDGSHGDGDGPNDEIDDSKETDKSKGEDGLGVGERSMEEVDASKFSKKASSLDTDEEELLIDDADAKAHQEEERTDDVNEAQEGEAADDAREGHKEETDDAVEKAHEEEQPDVDMEVVNKADLEETEMAAIE